MEFEEFAARRGASFSDVGDAGAHKRARWHSDKQWRRIIKALDRRAADVVSDRASLRKEYDALVAHGILRDLTRMERIERAARGHPDNASTQAALRILARLTAPTPPAQEN